MRSIPACALLLLLLLLTGCGTRGAVRVTPMAAAPPPPVLAASANVGLSAPADRLPDDVWRTIRDLNWGLLNFKAWRADEPGADPVTRVHAAALLPDGRTVLIEAQGHRDHRINAHAWVKPFGDRKMEVQFLTTLQQTLNSPPRPRRDAEFDLPPWPGIDVTAAPAPR